VKSENPYSAPHSEFQSAKPDRSIKSFLFIPIGFISSFTWITLLFIATGVFRAAEVNIRGILLLTLLSFLSTLPFYPLRNAARFIHIIAPPLVCLILMFLGSYFFPVSAA